MKRLLILGLGAAWAGWVNAQQPVSVYPPPAELPFIQIGAQDVPLNPPGASPVPEKMPAPSAVPAAPATPAVSSAPTMTSLPGTTLPIQHNSAGYVPYPVAGLSPCTPSSPGCMTCVSCDVPCGTPLFPTGCRSGERPVFNQLKAWLGYHPGPRVLPVMIPQGPQHRPLYTYLTPTPATLHCASGNCGGTAPAPVLGFHLNAPRMASAPVANHSGHLAYSPSGCATCPPACGTPLFPQRLTSTCGLPGYLTPQAYPAASYAPAPTLLSRIINFFTPNRYGFNPCSWTAPPANCPSCPGPVMVGSSGQWSGGSCGPNGCGSPAMMSPSVMPQVMPQSMPQALPTSPQTSLTPGYRFAMPLTQLVPRTPAVPPVQQVQHQVPVANQPFSKP